MCEESRAGCPHDARLSAQFFITGPSSVSWNPDKQQLMY